MMTIPEEYNESLKLPVFLFKISYPVIADKALKYGAFSVIMGEVSHYIRNFNNGYQKIKR